MINLHMENQPNDETCGPTCLRAVYNYYGLDISLKKIIREVQRSRSGGTLAAYLGTHALKHKFNATIYVNNLDIFDLSWFTHQGHAHHDLALKLERQIQYKKNRDIVQSSEAYLEYLQHGGEIRFRTLKSSVLKDYFDQKRPIISGLSATYLYRSAREVFDRHGKSKEDDVRGTPCGHFVVLCGYDELHRRVVVADPTRTNPISYDNYYKVSINRLLNAIMLGVLTYDANLLILEPSKEFHANHSSH
jgi:hypothetical protein